MPERRVAAALLAVAVAAAAGSPRARGEANLSGQTGFIYMPSARVQPEGAWRLGASSADPYFTGWSSVSLFPRLEFSARYTRIAHLAPGFEDEGYGDYKDKAFDAKLVLAPESAFTPQVAIGAQDFTGTRLFAARYAVLGKRIGDFDWGLGYGAQRIDGWFGGVRYRPPGLHGLGLVLEYDATRYRDDFQASTSGALERAGGPTYGIEYRRGWFAGQVSYQSGEVGANLYVTVPLDRREYIPKIDEPPPFARARAAGPPLAQWLGDPAAQRELARALESEGFRPVEFAVAGRALEVRLAHPRISVIGRAVGRAARVLRALGPNDLERLRIVYTLNDLPVLTYVFDDPALLDRFLAGEIDVASLERGMRIAFASPEAATDFRSLTGLVPPAEEVRGLDLRYGEDGHALLLRSENASGSRFTVVPLNVRFFFNDPSGALHYDSFAGLDYARRLARGWFLLGGARLTLFEDVSEVTQPSDSLLPHVRSDIAEYLREGGRLRLDRLLVNRYHYPGEQVYARWSAGYYEEMYGGVGVQFLYLPEESAWAADVAVDALRQRAPGELFAFRDYRTVTALASLHYRIPRHGITATTRLGRFLARDEGVRLELKRRFRSGIELGGWYSFTDAQDLTGPGRPGDPYRDKGLFLSIPLRSMLTRDTRERAHFSLVDFTRDVGQMARSPGDLYRQLELARHLDDDEHSPFMDFRE